MTFLITGSVRETIKHKRNYLCIYCPEIYGADSWGMNAQEDLVKARKNWYFTYWRGGGEYCEDYYEKNKAKVLLETTNADEVIRWVDKKLRDRVSGEVLTEILQSVLNDLENIFHKWLAVERWVLK